MRLCAGLGAPGLPSNAIEYCTGYTVPGFKSEKDAIKLTKHVLPRGRHVDLTSIRDGRYGTLLG
jgi:hypothetical protein